MAARRLHHEDYTVAWICALPVEMAAAEAMLDERHPDLPTTANDANTYILGRVHVHNVVIACLPYGVYGTTSAATLATQIRFTFTAIQFGLMVGIGGGVPGTPEDIKLGDVVVSKPTREYGGVIQYDFGKVHEGRWERVGVLNKPPTVLLTAISRLQAAHMLRSSQISGIISAKLASNLTMRETFQAPDECESVDEKTSDGHVDGMKLPKTCRIHYGLIASGNKVIKDSKIRDILSRKHGILCFEMEAAGLMNDFPCLVVRGICDYADARKNKQWQGYASLTAAAYTKELLGVVHTNYVDNGREWYMDTKSIRPQGREYAEWAVQIDRPIDGDLLERITPYDHEKVHQRLSLKKLVGTTQWFLDHPGFQKWLRKKARSALWCCGKIGSGKSIIATSVVEKARIRSSKRNIPVVFFYCDEQQMSNHEGLILSSFIKQILTFLLRTSFPMPEEIKNMLHRHFGRQRQRPTTDDLQTIFAALFTAVPNVICILDGLDSLDHAHAKNLLFYLQSLFTSHKTNLKMLFLSRDHLPGNMDIAMFVPGIRRISTSENVMKDIKVYIESSIMDKMMSKRVTDDEDLVQEMKCVLLNESSGMFLWVYLQIEIIWQTCATNSEICDALRSLPKDLEETYRRCITRINVQDPRVVKALSWVRFATRPLHIDELREAIAFEVHDTRWDKSRIPRGDFVMGSCVNLLVLDPTDSCVRFVHSSMNQYLDANRSSLIPGFPMSREQGDMDCGEFCVAYLSFADFSLQLDRYCDDHIQTVVPSSFIFPAKLPGSKVIRRLFPPRVGGGRSITLSFRRIKTSSTPSQAQYRFLDYAVSNWAVQTRHLKEGQGPWDKFQRLALSFNETWNFSPWWNGCRSQLSHLHGLFGWAIREHHLPLFNLALTFKKNIRDICDVPLVDEGLPPLHLACHLGHDKMVLELISICDVNRTGVKRYTPLHCAAAKGHTNVVDILLHKKGIDVDPLSSSGETPLFLAARHGWESVVRTLLLKGAFPDFKDDRLQTPLIVAAASGHLAAVEMLVKGGASIYSRDSHNLTCISWAIRNNHLAVLNILLEHDERLCSLDKIYPELVTAIDHEQQEIVKLMVGKGLNPNSILDGENMSDSLTLLSWAVVRGNEDLVLLLLGKGANVNPENEIWWTPLARAAAFGREAIVKFLIRHGAHVNPRNALYAPLEVAAENGQTAIVELLIDNGADIDRAGSYHQYALQSAARGEHVSTVRILLDRGAKLGSARDECNHLLIHAARRGDDATIRVLLDHGADINFMGHLKQTALMVASRKGHQETCELLVERGARSKI